MGWGFWNEWGGVVILVVAVSLIIFFTGGCLVGNVTTDNNKADAMSQAKHDLQIQGYTVYDGVVNSPTVIQTTSDYTYFVGQVENMMPVYETKIGRSNGFIGIFNATYGLAFLPEYHTSYFWGL